MSGLFVDGAPVSAIPPALLASCPGCGWTVSGSTYECRECALRQARVLHLVGWLADLNQPMDEPHAERARQALGRDEIAALARIALGGER